MYIDMYRPGMVYIRFDLGGLHWEYRRVSILPVVRGTGLFCELCISGTLGECLTGSSLIYGSNDRAELPHPRPHLPVCEQCWITERARVLTVSIAYHLHLKSRSMRGA